MTGLEKITDQIMEETKASAAAKRREAQQEADRILAEAKEQCDAIRADADAQSASSREIYEGRVKSSMEQQRRTELLRAKQEIIADVIREAYQKLNTEDTASYFLTMEQLLNTYALAADGEICFSAGDLARMPADFEDRIRAAAEKKGGSLTLSREPKAIEDGFVLVYGGIEENCTLKALFDAKKDLLQDKVNEILFL